MATPLRISQFDHPSRPSTLNSGESLSFILMFNDQYPAMALKDLLEIEYTVLAPKT